MQKITKIYRTRVADFWDDVLEGWRGDPHMRDLPDPLPRWRRSYNGEVDLNAYPEAFIGDLRGEKREPRLVVLGLNPGIAYPQLQGPDGAWTRAARKLTYSRSSDHRVPFENAAWRIAHGGDSRYFVNLVSFAKRWLKDDKAGIADILNMEMLPFHSKNKTRDIRPPHDILENYVWAPLREMEADIVFAFGADWESVCNNLSLIASYGPNERQRDLDDPTNGNWQVNVYSLGDKRIVTSWQTGYAGPSGKERTDELRRVVNEAFG